MSRKTEKYGGVDQQTENDEGSQRSFSAVADSLATVFGEVMERDALFAIVESCNGDQSLAAEALIQITGQNPPQICGDQQPECSSSHTTSSTQQQSQIVNPPDQLQSLSYCNVAKAPGSSNNQTLPTQPKKVPVQIWSEDLKRIFYYHSKGYRTLIILRGLPGSGKSYLAQEILEMTVGPGLDVYNEHVFSSDDFFYINGIYFHNKYNLGQAHDWNKKRVSSNLRRGRSPVIVDNTNVKYWEMEWYARVGVQEGYYIEILEPQTQWAWNVNQLLRRNKHNVPLPTLRRMYENYDSSISGLEFTRFYNLHYPPGKQPPVLRLIPKIENNELPNQVQVAKDQEKVSAEQHQQIANVPSSVELDVAYKDDSTSGESNEGTNLDKYADVAKELEEFEQIDTEWEKGENWEEQDFQSAGLKSPQSSPKPQRNRDKEQLLPTIEECQDWSVLIPAWPQEIPTITQTEPIPVETRESSTCVEFGDTDHLNSKYKVVTGNPCDINFDYRPLTIKTYKANMFDKSTTTCDLDLVKDISEKRLFQQFRRMFKTIKRNDLKDIFDKCGGDVNWAVELVIGGVNQCENVGDCETSDSVTSDEEECEDSKATLNVLQTDTENASNLPKVTQLLTPKRIKKDKTISESSLQLKRQIEKNIVMPDKFYSDHTVRLRKGELYSARPNNPAGEGTSKDNPCDSSSSGQETSDTESSKSDTDENVTFNLGREFVKNLDRLFDRDSGGDDNWEHIMPMVTMPMSILNQINALWMQSLAYQVESQVAYTELMLKQDEEFARKLAEEEINMNKAGQQPEVPDLKEIMDMDLAQTLYQKDIDQWKKSAPNDWAAKMTIEKLVNLFPNISEQVLREVLMAHDNVFHDTVVTLLMSTEQTSVLEQDNGVNKFVMEKELERQAKIIEEEKKKQRELESSEWPMLSELDKVDMATVHSYRHSASEHLAKRNTNMQKAQDYIRKKMIVPAGYAFDIASHHKRQYEQANNLAASALIHVNHVNKTDKNTLDLHYLYVAEALQTLDLYIDHHIKLLQEQQPHSRRMLKTDLFFITGRGRHSQGREPKIKPAVRIRLKQRGFRVYELNPGLLSIKLTQYCQLTHQLPK